MAIDLGSIVPIGGRNVGSGIVSGLDTEAVIESLTALRQQPIDDIDEDLELNAEKISAYTEFTSLLESLQSAADFLRNPPGVQNDSSNIFNFLTTSSTSTTLATPENFVTIDADPGAIASNIDIAVGNVAQSLSQLSQSFTSQTASISEAAGGTTAGQFSAGTFQLASNVAIPTNVSTSTNNTLTTEDYTVVGNAGTSVLTAAGIENFTTTSGVPNFIGSLSGFGGTFNNDPTNDLSLSITISGRTFTSNTVSTVNGAGSNAIAAGETFTFTESVTGSSFELQTGAEFVIDNDVNNVNAFISAIEADLSTQSIYQNRQISNFQDAAIQSTLNGLTSANVSISSNDFDEFGNFGQISGFTLTPPSSTGAGDGAISVTINDQIYQATGLGQPSVLTSTTGLTASDFSSDGTDSGTTFTGGFTNFVTTDGTPNLIGTASGFTASFSDGGGFPNNTVSFSVDINGTTFTADNIAIDDGTDQIANGTVTFTDGTTSFDVTIADNTLLTITDQATADTAAGLFTSGLANYSITQTRELDNVNASLATGTSLDGLSSSNVLLSRDDFATTGLESGTFGPFSITRNGVDDSTLSVVINGETYEATGLADSQSGNITLTSTTDSGNQLAINLGDAGVGALDLSSQGAADAIAADLNTVFQADDVLNGNLTLIGQTDSNDTLSINLADAGLTLDFEDATDSTLLTAALNNAFGTGNLADITIEEGDSLQDIVANINANSASSGVSANILQVSSNDFRLQLNANGVGLDNAYQIIDQDSVTSEVTFNTQQAAQDAVVSVNGVVVTRSSNNISDVLDGLTFNVNQVTTSFSDQASFDGLGAVDSISTTIEPDISLAESGIVNFITAYNEFRAFAIEQGIRDEETGDFVEGAVLGDETVLQNLIRQASNEINRVVGGTSDSNFSALANLGIVFTDFEGDDETPPVSNILTYDPDQLQEALRDNFDQVREIFEFSFTASSPDISIFERNNNASLTDYRLDIDTSRSEGDEVRVLDLNGTFLFNATLNGTRIEGQDGTDLEGTTLIYSGDGTDLITIDSSQGIADRIFNTLFPLTDDGGSIDVAVEIIQDENDRLDVERTNQQDSLDTFRQQLLNRFAALEAAIQTANTLLGFLEAQSDVNNRG